MTDAIIGIKCLGHDTSIFVLRQGESPFGLDKERITRYKHDVGFPYEPLDFIKESLHGRLIFSCPDIKASYRALRLREALVWEISSACITSQTQHSRSRRMFRMRSLVSSERALKALTKSLI